MTKRLTFPLHLSCFAVTLLMLCACPAIRAQSFGMDNPSGVSAPGGADAGFNFNPYTGGASRTVTDLKIDGAVSAYGLAFSRTFFAVQDSAAESAAPATFFGGHWRHSFQWNVVPYYGVQGFNDSYPVNFAIYFPDGRIVRVPVNQNPNPGSSPLPSAYPYELPLSPRNGIKERFIVDDGLLVNANIYDSTKPVGSQNKTTHFHVILADGGRIKGHIEMGPSERNASGRLQLKIAGPSSRYDVVVESIQDPNGLETKFAYEEASSASRSALKTRRLTSITDASGRYISLQYLATNPLGSVADGTLPYSITGGSGAGGVGRKVIYGYANGPLSDVTYDEGANAHYDYTTTNTILTVAKLNDPRADAPRSLQLNFYPAGDFKAGALQTASYFDPAGINPTTIVSSYTYTSGTPLIVKETRGDGPVRSWTFGNAAPKQWQVTASTDWEGFKTSFTYDSNGFLYTVTDPNLHTTTFVNEPVAGQVTQITFNQTTAPPVPTPPPGATPGPTPPISTVPAFKKIVYDDPANPYWVQSVTDEMKHTTSYTPAPGPNPNHLVGLISYPDGSTESFDTFNRFNQPTHHTKRNGTVETFVFDTTANSYTVGLLQSVSVPLVQTGQTTANLVTTFGYYNSGPKEGRILTVTTPSQNSTTYSYNQYGQVVSAAYRDASYSFIQKHYDQYGRLDWEEDELTHRSSFFYDPYDRVTRALNPPRSPGQASLETRYTYARVDSRYPASSNELAHTQAKPRQITSTGGKLTLFKYDRNFRTLTRTDGFSTLDAATTTWHYDDAGNADSTTAPPTVVGTTGVVTTNQYDERNRLITSTTPVGKTTIFYDNAGNVIRRYSPDGNFVSFDSYDGMNQLQHALDERGKPISMSYFPSGKLKTVTDVNNKIYEYKYDSLDQRSRLTYPDGSYEEWLSQPNGLPQSARGRAGDIQSFNTYDLRDRLKTYSWSDGSVPPVTIGYDKAGRVTSLANANSTVTRDYYDDDTLKSETQAIAGAPTRQIIYTPDNEGLPHRIKYPNGLNVRQNFDNLNRLVLAGQDDGTETTLLAQFASYAYNGDSTRQNIVRGNGVRTDFTYETPVTGRIRNLNHYVPAAGSQPARTISSRTYGYDALDRMRWFQKSASTATNPLENGRGESYGYDPAGQLTSAAFEVANPAGANVPNDTFSYDGVGNRTSMNGVAYTLNPSDLNQYATAGSYGTAGYGGRGNLSALGGFSAGYDSQNEMTSASANGNSVSFAYDAVGRCVKRTVNGTLSYFYYDGWSLIEEDNSAGAAQMLYVHGPATDELAAMWTASSNSWAWYHYDARGSVTHLTNGSGQLIEQYSYGAWGTPSYYDGGGNLRAGSAFNNRFLFQGRDWIKVLGVYDFRNRIYHPGIGRFLQPDPLSLDAGDPNIYRYCNNDPINGSDPLGLEPDFFASLSNWWGGGGTASYYNAMDSIFGSGGSSTTTWSVTSSELFSSGPSFLDFGFPLLGMPGVGRMDFATVSFAPPPNQAIIKTITKEQMYAKTKGMGNAVTDPDVGPARGRLNITGGISVAQTVRAITYLPNDDTKAHFLGIEMGKGEDHFDRIGGLRGATDIANAQAMQIAVGEFSDIASAEKAVYESTDAALHAYARKAKHVDLFHKSR